MKLSIYIVVIFFSLTSCTQKQKENRGSGDFDFLIGDWERTNSEPGVSTLEHWAIINPNEYRGHGYTIEQKDTTFQEWMYLFKKNEQWSMEIAGPNERSTPFKITSHTATSLIAENPEHDFPKKITYAYFDDTLTAKVSNEEMVIPFIFWRIE